MVFSILTRLLQLFLLILEHSITPDRKPEPTKQSLPLLPLSALPAARVLPTMVLSVLDLSYKGSCVTRAFGTGCLLVA